MGWPTYAICITVLWNIIRASGTYVNTHFLYKKQASFYKFDQLKNNNNNIYIQVYKLSFKRILRNRSLFSLNLNRRKMNLYLLSSKKFNRKKNKTDEYSERMMKKISCEISPRYFLCITSVYVTFASTICCAWWICTQPPNFVFYNTDYRIWVADGIRGGWTRWIEKRDGQVAWKIVTRRSNYASSSIRIESLIAKGWTIYLRS